MCSEPMCQLVSLTAWVLPIPQPSPAMHQNKYFSIRICSFFCFCFFQFKIFRFYHSYPICDCLNAPNPCYMPISYEIILFPHSFFAVLLTSSGNTKIDILHSGKKLSIESVLFLSFFRNIKFQSRGFGHSDTEKLQFTSSCTKHTIHQIEKRNHIDWLGFTIYYASNGPFFYSSIRPFVRPLARSFVRSFIFHFPIFFNCFCRYFPYSNMNSAEWLLVTA